MKPTTAISPTRAENFAEWYQQVVRAAKLAEHAPVRGCMTILPWGYGVWELMQQALDVALKATGHKNVYFPLLIPLSYLEREAAHVSGFAKECAVVTHHRLVSDGAHLVPSPDARLDEPLVIRPTSEAIIGEAFARWISSYRDLPLLINQWCNVMRWELRTRVFLRTSEFLWQEGHTAHADAGDANAEARRILDLYADFAEDVMALPVIKGEKTPLERFPGAICTYCIEAILQDGKALQAGTAHFLGQNFALAYDITFMDARQARQHAWTTSWGMSTRMIGGMIMMHSDDNGLVLPPRAAPAQVRIIPIASNPHDLGQVQEFIASRLKPALQGLCWAGSCVRVEVLAVEGRPGAMFWQAVKDGVPLILQVGKREIERNTVSIVSRLSEGFQAESIALPDLGEQVPRLLASIQSTLLSRARALQSSLMRKADTLDALQDAIGTRAPFGWAVCPMDIEAESSEKVQIILAELGATIRCVPLALDRTNAKCIFTGKPTPNKVVIAKAY
ncbi:aminoacyl--tRNA ligase-related protein [Cupriavidus alkaliphilus]|uniref:aminoacyl--tRNA ligase-related protein n=1 Tax=Cupriavidus alkaliphilus TaxID=942866 RepID=UPI0016122351|nr:aminoacyl--tRNA ligase-related protein [Cupriavidus alkaliphilus]MBB3012567.1 prolyl-tRNA synthetase [Cupriavidus alkaliphilus]